MRSTEELRRHGARTFSRLPDASEATRLLVELASATCEFAPLRADGPVLLYGAGDLGLLAHDHLRSLQVSVPCVADQHAEARRTDPRWRNVEVVSPDAVPDELKASALCAVSVGLSAYVPIEVELSALGFRRVTPFYDVAESYRSHHPLSNGWFAAPFDEAALKEITQVLGAWSDDVSRAHHLQFLAWRRLREEWTFLNAPIEHRNRYFIDAITACMHAHEVFVDAGAYHGSVVESFLQKRGGRFRQIVAIEPDRASRAHLTAVLNRLRAGDARLSVLPVALGETSQTQRFFEGLGYASQLADTGQSTVDVVPLDRLSIPVTFLKLHLEGGELPALKGASRTLATLRPIVVSTVYHNEDGIWRTPAWLMRALPDYHFLFRLHSWCGTGAVVYAIPPERLRTSA